MDVRKTGITLDPSEIPYDITFVIEECGSKVKAHKLIMAMCSPIFKKQFYGELKEIEGEIVIKDATKDAFVTMLDFFYCRELDWEKKTVEEFFEIANMAEKYQVNALKEKIEVAVREFLHLSKENVVMVAAIVKKYSQFEDLANYILEKCRVFLSSVLTLPDDYCEYAKKYVGSEFADVALELQAEMKEVGPNLKKCCKLNTCRRGKPMMTVSDFELGEMVQFNPGAKDHVEDAHRIKCVEGTVDAVKGIVLSTESGRHIIMLKGGEHWIKERMVSGSEKVPTFLFCKC